MSASCKECHAVILQSTFDRQSGLCTPCFRKKHITDTHYRVPAREVVLPPLLTSLIEGSQAHCLIDCCGLNAIEITDESMASWLEAHSEADRKALLQEVDSVVALISSAATPVQCYGDDFAPEELIEKLSLPTVA